MTQVSKTPARWLVYAPMVISSDDVPGGEGGARYRAHVGHHT